MRCEILCKLLGHKYYPWSAPFWIDGTQERVRICKRCNNVEERKEKDECTGQKEDHEPGA